LTIRWVSGFVIRAGGKEKIKLKKKKVILKNGDPIRILTFG